MIHSSKKFLKLSISVFFLFLLTFQIVFCGTFTKVDFSKYVPQKTIEIHFEKLIQNELYSVSDPKNQSKKTDAKEPLILSNILSLSFEPNTIIIPPNTKYTLTLNAYCLKSSGAGPRSEEPYNVIHVNQQNDIRKLLNSLWGQCSSQTEVQSLAWNITNRVPHEAFPTSQRQMLSVSGLFQEMEEIPVVGFGVKVLSAPISIAKDVFVYTVGNFAHVEMEILNRQSRYEMPPKPEPSQHGSFFIEVLSTNSFREQFYPCTTIQTSPQSFKQPTFN